MLRPPVDAAPFAGINRWLHLTYCGDCSNSDSPGTLVSGRPVRKSFNWCLCTYSWVSAPRRRCLRFDSLLVPGLPNFGYQSIKFPSKKTLMLPSLTSIVKPAVQSYLLCVTNSYALLECQIIKCPLESSYNISANIMTQRSLIFFLAPFNKLKKLCWPPINWLAHKFPPLLTCSPFP
jgi:hypothetical protein